jgi:hypothetical protein
MRVAILCNARSGSQSLYNLLENHFTDCKENYFCISEPFNNSPNFVALRGEINTIDIFENKPNVLIKTFATTQMPNTSFEKWDDYVDWLFSYFDKVILLDRRYKRPQAESLAYHEKILNKIGPEYSWHTPKYYDLKPEDEESIGNFVRDLEWANGVILKYHKERNVPIFYYEDIFLSEDMNEINRMFDYLNIELKMKFYDDWVSNKGRVVRIKQNNKTNKLI